jgi:peptide/nickel transport system substrate-binding protein
MKLKPSKILIIALSSTLWLGGCATQEVKPTPTQDNEVKDQTTQATPVKTEKSSQLNYAIWSSPKGVFNPILLNDIYDRKVSELIFSPLLTLNADNEIIPALATSYTVSDDNLSITFYLREDVVWHDGTSFTAEDVAFTFTSIADPGYTGPRFAEIEKLVGAKDYRDGKAEQVAGIEVLDEHTIRFDYEEVYAPALANFAIRGILPKHIWQSIPVAEWEQQTALLTQPIGTGAYKLVKFIPDQYVELERNEDYFLGTPKIEKVILKVSNQDTAQAEILNGTLDVAVLSSFKQQDFDTYLAVGKEILEYPGASYQFMTMNLNDPLFKDQRVRQAITYAIDRSALVSQLLEGHGSLINAPLIVSSWAYPKEGLNTYTYDPEKAKALLKEAGWDSSVTVDLLVPIGNKVREQSAPVIQHYLKEVGIQVNLLTMDFASVKAKVYEESDYQLALMGFSLELDPADAKSYWGSELADKPGFNFSNLKSQESDDLLDKASSTLDQTVRQGYYSEWAKLINETAPFVFLYSPNETRVYDPAIVGYDFSNFIEFPNIHEWSVDK